MDELNIGASPQIQPLDNIGVVEITQKEKETFFESFLADKPYTEEVGLFSGKIKLKFRTMTVQENAAVGQQISLDRAAGRAEASESYYVTIGVYRLAVCLEEINGVPVQKITAEEFGYLDNSSTDGITYIAHNAKQFENWSSSKLGAYLDAFNLFEQKVLKLTKSVSDPNFWEAAE